MIGETFMHVMVKEMQTFIQLEHFTLIKKSDFYFKKNMFFLFIKES